MLDGYILVTAPGGICHLANGSPARLRACRMCSWRPRSPRLYGFGFGSYRRTKLKEHNPIRSLPSLSKTHPPKLTVVRRGRQIIPPARGCRPVRLSE